MKRRKLAKRGEAKKFLSDILNRKRFGNDCIEWPFAVNNDGYGRVNWKNKNVHASVLVCGFFKKKGKGKQVAHSCGRRNCLNPKHLRWATKSENEADKKIHGTVPNMKGERNFRSKLKASDVVKIRKLRGKEFMKITADRYDVHLSVISKIQNKQIWTSV